MPRKKTVQPDPLESLTLEDGTIVEIRDESCQIIGRGLHKRDAYEINRDHVLEKIVPIYVTHAGRKKLGRKQKDILKSAAEFERWYTLQGFPERNETDVRKRLYNDIKSKIKVYINAVEASKQQGTSSPQNRD